MPTNASNYIKRSGLDLMPPEIPPCYRRGEFFRERRNGYVCGYEYGVQHHSHNICGGGGGGGGRLRDSPCSPFVSGSRNSAEFSPRRGLLPLSVAAPWTR